MLITIKDEKDKVITQINLSHVTHVNPLTHAKSISVFFSDQSTVTIPMSFEAWERMINQINLQQTLIRHAKG